MPKILIVDDEKDVHYSFRRILKGREDTELLSAHSGEEALQKLEHGPEIDLVIMDVRMGGLSGIEVLKRIQKEDVRQKPLVIMMTAYSTADVAIEATKQGAFDYVIKPFNVEKMKSLVQEALHARQAMNKSVAFEQSDADVEGDEPDRIVGRHPSMQEVYKMIGRVAQTDALVLIQGESGAGKELVARAIYHHSPRKNKMFLPINCAAIPDNLLESELFGHERGAFTGAVERRVGKFEQCDGGALFLDEIGDFSSALQGKILRLLEDQTFQRVGGTKWLTSDVRLIAATNCNLAQMVEKGQFRQDLYYRLNVVSITLPPLRRRIEDIPDLVRFFIRRYGREYGREKTGVSTAALEKLMAYSWPGNVRQLENAVKRALLIARGELLLVDDFELATPDSDTGSTRDSASTQLDNAAELLRKVFKTVAASPPDKGILPWIERNLVQSALEHTDGNQVQASKLLGISRNTLRARMKELGLDNHPES